MPSIIQYAFAAEALINTPAIIALLFFPNATLKPFLATPLPSIEVNASATLLARCLGVLILGLTPQLLLAYPNTGDRVGKRRLVYWTLGVGEAGLIPLFIWEAFRASDEAKAAGVWAGGLSRNMALTCAANLVAPIAWRIFVFAWKPQWFAGEDDKGKGRRKE
ncbi:hypothetical protein N7G274_005675 [Stereocaulon virgatum]|uniref:Uncharacterized protein n=1 Tax=Stereocaulon virgatum TaxID=373712 RepID=A0ABR4A6H6_9LECA